MPPKSCDESSTGNHERVQVKQLIATVRATTNDHPVTTLLNLKSIGAEFDGVTHISELADGDDVLLQARDIGYVGNAEPLCLN